MIADGTMNEDAVVIGVLGEHAEPRDAIMAAIAGAGATALALTEVTATTKGAGVGAILFDAGDAPERLLPAAVSLANDPRTRFLPRVVVVDGAVSAARLAAFGPAILVPDSALGEVLEAAIGGLVQKLRERSDILRAAHAARADLQMLEQTLAAVEQEAVTLSHDARVLFGIILGFASNLRDGFGGPVTELQHRQLVNIVDASTDATTLLDRHVTALRRLVPAWGEQASTPRAAGRRQVDLGELVRRTVGLFQGLAAAKRIRLGAEAAVAARAWCDDVQIKQALVNVVSNALKFTPAGGRVEVIVRPGPLAAARNGSPPKRDVEIAVTDTGPGIPAHERERVFERGVRLERDIAIPGTGAGLAIVRDIVTSHGGLVRIEDGPGSGTSIVLVLPADLRGRSGEHPRTNVSPAPPRVRSTSVPPSSPRLTELRREPE